MNLFPMIQPELELKDASLPMYKEIAWDFEHNIQFIKMEVPNGLREKKLYWFGLGKRCMYKNIVIQFTVGITDVS